VSAFRHPGWGAPGTDHPFHVTLVLLQWGPDNRLSGQSLRCANGQRATFHVALKEGTYYFVFDKLNDDRLYEGIATVSYPT
jgi:hypothetical protein